MASDFTSLGLVSQHEVAVIYSNAPDDQVWHILQGSPSFGPKHSVYIYSACECQTSGSFRAEGCHESHFPNLQTPLWHILKSSPLPSLNYKVEISGTLGRCHADK